MKKDKNKDKKFEKLREKAENKLDSVMDDLEADSEEKSKEIKNLMHELQVHQVELEMQNEELRKAQNQLKKSRQRYKHLYDFAPVAYFTFDKKGNIQNLNLTAANLLGDNRTALQDSRFYSYIAEKDRDDFYLHIKDVFGSSNIYSCELQLQKEDGTKFWGQLQSKLVEDTNDNAPTCRTIIRDITKQKQAEAEKEKMQEQLLQNKKLQSIGSLSAGIAHDYNNKLTVIQGNSELIMRETDRDDPRYNKLEEILATTQAAAELTRKILLFSTNQNLSTENLDLNSLIQSLHKILAKIINENILIKTILEDDLDLIEADRKQMEQVIMNVVTNAQEAMPEGGSITLRTQSIFLDEEQTRTKPDLTPGKYVKLEVEDEGEGIEEKKLDNIFDPFYSTKGMAERTGLGLSVAFGIVKKHNGYIEADSTKGEGTTIRIYLPAKSEEKKEKEEKEEKSHISSSKEGTGESVLVVEDEEVVRNFLKQLLNKMNYNVYEAKDGEQAREIFSEEKDNIKLLLSDVVMPGMNGITLAEKLQKQKEDLKVILSSGYSKDKVDKTKINKQGYEFISKPYEIDDLLSLLKDLLS